jgi:TonB family protein
MKSTLALAALLALASAPVWSAEPVTAVQPEAATRPCRIIAPELAKFPLVMINNGVKLGTVRVMLQVDEKGQLGDMLVTAYSDESFAEEVRRVVQKWKFEPALEDGQPVGALLELTYKFELNGIVFTQTSQGIPVRFGDSPPTSSPTRPGT